MRISSLVLVLSGLVLSACAATTPAPRLSVRDPADPRAPESVVEPRSTLLEGPAEQSSTAPAGSEAMPLGHEHHMESPSSSASPTADVYSCLMHPQVREATPGKCPICGMTLVKQPAKAREERQP